MVALKPQSKKNRNSCSDNHQWSMVSRTPSPDYLHPSLRHEMSRLFPERRGEAHKRIHWLRLLWNCHLPQARQWSWLMEAWAIAHVLSPAWLRNRVSLHLPPVLKAAWFSAAIKAVSEQISAMQTTLQSPAAGQLQKSTLDNLLNMVPLQVQALYPKLRSLHANMEESEGGTVSNACGS